MDENKTAVGGAAMEGPGTGDMEPQAAAPERTAGTPEYERDAEADRRSLQQEREKTRLERARLAAEEQVRQIGQLDGAVKSLDDLLAMPGYDGFYSLVKKGVSLVDAYKLTHYDRLMKRAADAAARQTARSLDSRRHLTALAGQPGAGEYVSVPAEVAAEYRLAKPGITDEEIRRKYRKYQKYER